MSGWIRYGSPEERTRLDDLPKSYERYLVNGIRAKLGFDAVPVRVDEHVDGTLVAEIDDGDHPRDHVPGWLDVLREVTLDEEWTGAGLARRLSPPA